MRTSGYQPVSSIDNEEAQRPEETKEADTSSTPSSELVSELAGVASSISPNDFLVSLSFFLAALYVANLPGYAALNDGAKLALITIVAHACIRIITQGYQLPAGFAHIGLSFDEQTRKLNEAQIDKQKFTNSIAAMVKMGMLSSIPAMIFLGMTPLLYQLAGGTSEALINDSYYYIPFGCAALIFQNCNVGFQQTLLKLEKKNRMLRTAAFTGLFTVLPILSLILFGNPIKSISPLITLGAIFLMGSFLVTLNHALYFNSKGWLPKISTYYDSENAQDINKVFTVFRTVGFNIFLQLVSELLAVYVQPFIALLLFAKEQLGAILALLNGAGSLNLFTIIFAITISQAVGNAIDSILRHLRENNFKNPAQSYEDIRKILHTSFIGMLTFSFVMNVALMTAIAPTIAGLFYDTNSIDIPSPSNNPYAVIAFIGTGTTIDYLRNLALFVLRSFGVNDYGTYASYLCLWLLNPILVAGLSQVKNIGVFGILAPYYASLLIGTILLWKRVYECTHKDKTLNALINPEDQNHKEVEKKVQRCFPQWLMDWSVSHPDTRYRRLEQSPAVAKLLPEEKPHSNTCCIIS